jgi:hypothetical protein
LDELGRLKAAGASREDTNRVFYFALEDKAAEIAGLMRDFLARTVLPA